MTLSLRAKLALIYGAVFLAAIGALEVTLYLSAQSALDSVINDELASRQVGVVEYLHKHLTKLSWDQIREALLRDHEALRPRLLTVTDANGAVLFESPTLAVVAAGPDTTLDFASANTRLRVRRVTTELHGASYRLVMASDLGFPSAVMHRLWLVMLLSSPLTLGAAMASGYWISGRALRPVGEITTLAELIANRDAVRLADLGQRVTAPERSDELQRLATAINCMLAKIEESFRQMSRFTADVSHELRTPLSVIRATAEIALLRVSPDEESYRQALGRILRESEKHSSLLESMLRLSRFEAGVERGRSLCLDLNLTLPRAVEQLSPLAVEKGLTLEARLEGEPCWIEADEDHLHWLWTILLENAIKYTPAGGQVLVHVESVEGRHACVVTDTGMGIDPRDVPHIFERFYRAETSRSRATGGAGLGLSIAHQIAEVYGARIEVESRVGSGACFRVWFPDAAEAVLRQSSGKLREDVTGRG